VNELTTYQNHGHLAINNHIRGLQESFVYTNQFISLLQVKPIVPPKENKEEKEEVILIHSSPLPNDKSTTILSSNESMVSASKNPNIQLSEEINNLITSLK